MLDGQFDGKLLVGERVLWSGQPGQGIILTRGDAILIPFSLMWGGFAVFWETIAIRADKAPLILKLWDLPFVLIGLYLIVGRFLHDSYARARMYYAVTNQRVLILRLGRSASLTAIRIDRLADLRLAANSNGRGTIHFGSQGQAMGRNGSSALTPSLDPGPKFFSIEDAQTVFDQIQRAARSAS